LFLQGYLIVLILLKATIFHPFQPVCSDSTALNPLEIENQLISYTI